MSNPMDERPPELTGHETERVTDAELAEVLRIRSEESPDDVWEAQGREIWNEPEGSHVADFAHGDDAKAATLYRNIALPMARELIALRGDREVMKADRASTGEALLTAKREASEWQAKCNSAWAENGALRAVAQDLLKGWDSDDAAAAVAIIEELRKLAGEP